MVRLTEIKLPLDHSEADLRAAAVQRLEIDAGDLTALAVFRRGYDARRRSAIHLIYTLDVGVRDEAALRRRQPSLLPTPDTDYRYVARAPDRAGPRPVVIGCGPCGLLAALLLAQMGFCPIILERGKVVRERTSDTFALWRRGLLNPESNVQFGEGGAGTFSDGKLYSGIKDAQNLGRKVLTEFVRAGAPEEILYVSKPHIGTFRLVTMVENIRASIEALGGEYRFGAHVVDIDVAETPRRVRGVALANGEVIPAEHVVLAVGHSARDTFAMLHGRGVAMAAKPFSIGVRIEHPQALIDRARFGNFAGTKLLGAADYKLVHHGAGRSVYSFCMCPGGRVVAAASEPGGVVTNGMSQYSRAEFNANAGMVVGITPADYPGGPLAGIAYQRHWEQRAFAAGGGHFAAPVQRVGDFLAGTASTAVGTVVPSYQPGVTATDLTTTLPDFAIAALREALPAFGRQLPGFDMADAVMTGVETRTSSPLRIPRDENFVSSNTVGLYPAGEGAGYAGGILSAAVDGIKVAEAIALHMTGGTELRHKGRRGEAAVAYG